VRSLVKVKWCVIGVEYTKGKEVDEDCCWGRFFRYFFLAD